MRIASILLGVLAALVVTVSQASAADPVLTIVFAGNTYGYYDPCPTCGPQKLGGLARRATYIERMRNTQSTAGKTLVIAGAWELVPEVSAQPPEPDMIPAVAKAHERLGYDAMVLSPAEVKLLADKNVAPPKDAVLLGHEPTTRIIRRRGSTIGLVFFPMPKDASAPVPDRLMDVTAKAAKDLRNKADLIIGISPWGAFDEEAFINTRHDAVDVLLGSGGGSGFPARASKDGKTLWTRAYIKGKTVNRLDLLALPSKTDNVFAWKSGASFLAKVEPLDEAFPQDVSIERLFK